MVDGEDNMALDCKSCGACCASYEVVVDQWDKTPRYLTRSVRNIMGFASWEADEGIRRMNRVGDRCASLRGEIGECVSCAVYDRRPSVCREFMPGSDDCLECRNRHGLERAAPPNPTQSPTRRESS